MKLEPVSMEVVNKSYRPTKIQRTLDEFSQMDAQAVKVAFEPGEYKNAASAQSTYYRAIQRLKYPMKTQVSKGELYLIKLITPAEKTCETCQNFELGVVCKRCKDESLWEERY